MKEPVTKETVWSVSIYMKYHMIGKYTEKDNRLLVAQGGGKE
jgi:hypothetical protein